jgi:iron(III) transport system substrate-binding protein
MPTRKLSRRDLLQVPAALAFGSVTRPASVAAQPASVSADLIEAARAEGKLSWYAALDLPVAERMARAFEARYSGIAVRLERSGAERIFQRIGQEYASRIHTVDVVESSDAAHFIVWKRQGWLASSIPQDVAHHYPAEHRDPDGLFATWRLWLSVIGYNTKLVKPDEAPQGFADLLDPRWMGKIVKSHPSYSGATLTATYEIARELGWSYFEKLARQKVMQVQSSNDSPKKVAFGERAVMADGNEHALIRLKGTGQPIEAVYPREGTPLITGPAAVFTNAPNPSAARLFYDWMFSVEAQQLLVDVGGMHSAHPLVKVKPGRRSLSEIKLMKDDPAAVEAQSEEIKANYVKYFRV